MTLGEAIAAGRALKPDVYTDEQMAAWISDLDGQLSLELLEAGTATAYTWPDSADTALLIPSPYDGVYPLYIVAMTDFHNRETDSYQNDMQLVNEALYEYKAYFRRNNRPAYAGGFKWLGAKGE